MGMVSLKNKEIRVGSRSRCGEGGVEGYDFRNDRYFINFRTDRWTDLSTSPSGICVTEAKHFARTRSDRDLLCKTSVISNPGTNVFLCYTTTVYKRLLYWVEIINEL